MNENCETVKREAEALLERAAQLGVVLAIERRSPEPFSMGKTVPVVHVWEKRP